MKARAEPMPISNQLLASIAKQHGTPCWVYDAQSVRAQIEKLRRFDVIRYAQKANSNLALLRLMRAAGVVVDAVSLGEIERALAAGFVPRAEPSQIVFTADVLDRATLERVVELGVPVNVGSPHMLEQLGEKSRGHAVWLRVNPGFGHGHNKKTNTGGEHSKHGIWHAALHESLALVERYGLELRGFHMHIGSGVDYRHLQNVCDAMVATVKAHGQDVRAISAGGGLSIPYKVGDPSVDTEHYFELWNRARREIESIVGHPVELEIEPGRFLVAQAGLLISELRAYKPMGGNRFVLVDAGFNDLMRPAMYGAYHGVSVLDPSGVPRGGARQDVVVAGPLCESGDVFTQNAGGEVETRSLPIGEVGDWVVFHDAGAYGASMSSNYNSRPLLPEVLVDGDEVRLVRRRQTITDLMDLER
jgi:diaminopimelate decarboxylase